MDHCFFTIGHSNRSLEVFLALLAEAEIALVADVRKMPMSRTNPQFNIDTLPDVLADFGIAYQHMAALGGLRGLAKETPSNANDYWENKSFHNYADYALSPEFNHGLEILIAEGRKQRTAIMCAEAVWWRCHRRIIADYLIARGERVVHLMGEDRQEEGRLTAGAIARSNGTIIYPSSQR